MIKYEYSYLHYTAGRYCLSFLYLIAYICELQPSPNPLPRGNHTSLFCVRESVSILNIGSLVAYFRFHI